MYRAEGVGQRRRAATAKPLGPAPMMRRSWIVGRVVFVRGSAMVKLAAWVAVVSLSTRAVFVNASNDKAEYGVRFIGRTVVFVNPDIHYRFILFLSFVILISS